MNITDYKSDTPLFKAVKTRAVECVQLLLKNGALVNSCHIRGRNALKYHLTSRLKSMKKLCVLLFAAGEKLDFLQSECRRPASVKNYKYIKKLTRRKLSLKDICRQAFRKHMLNVNSAVNLFVRIPTLELPSTLIKYLLYSVSLDSPTVIESGDHSDDDSDDHSDSDSDSYSSGGSTGSPSLFSVDEESDYSLTSKNSTEESDDRSETTENTDSNDDDDNSAAAAGVFGCGDNEDDNNDYLNDDGNDYYGDSQFTCENHYSQNISLDDGNDGEYLDDDEESDYSYDYGDDGDDNDYGEQDYDDIQFDADDEY